MPNKDTPYQTIGEFLNSPFGSKEIKPIDEYQKKYAQLISAKQIYCENYTIVDDMYLIHVKIPSESQPGLFYDVVIGFFTDDPNIENQLNLGLYYIQFYSNSPSFIYKYASLYKVYGYLIDTLYDKMDAEYSNRLPDKVNPDYKMSFDKSIYFACRYLKDNEFTLLRKSGLKFVKKVDMRKFLRSIRDYETVKADSELRKLEEGLKKETEKEKKLAKEQRKEFLHKLNPLHNNQKRSGGKVQKKKPTTSTVLDVEKSAVHKLIKRKPSRSTVLNKEQTSVRVIGKKKPGLKTRNMNKK